MTIPQYGHSQVLTMAHMKIMKVAQCCGFPSLFAEPKQLPMKCGVWLFCAASGFEAEFVSVLHWNPNQERFGGFFPT